MCWTRVVVAFSVGAVLSLPQWAQESVRPQQVLSAAASPSPNTASPDPVSNANTAEALNEATLSGVQTAFAVKYVAQDSVYLVGGRTAGLGKGMKLTIRRKSGVHTAAEGAQGTDVSAVAELEVVSVADTSAVCQVLSLSGEIHKGDIAYLGTAEAEALAQKKAISGSRGYPQVISFTDDQDPLEEEAREDVPRPPSPEINRARGRIGVEYMGLNSGGSVQSSSTQLGFVARADITRIGGTYWNLSGYWRGRLNNESSAGVQTMQDLLNRTYHLQLYYDNPNSHWVMGVGRLYLPWASSLDTLDGGYIGRKYSHVVFGIFGGSTPDPTSWDYNPDQRTAGTFINFEAGSFESVRFSSTSGLGMDALRWTLYRPYIFFENSLFYKRLFSIYHSIQADDPKPLPGVAAAGAGISRSYLTVRFQPTRRISFDVNHNYFRNVPTFNLQLVGTGLLDKYLFQGFSAGTNIELIKHISVYTDIGRSSATGDATHSLNQMYGLTFGQIWRTGFKLDARYSKFSSSFGSGNYRTITLSRGLGDRFRFEVEGGKQSLISTFTTEGSSQFINTMIDANFGGHYFLEANYNIQRGSAFNYNQWFLTSGYRFDTRRTATK